MGEPTSLPISVEQRIEEQRGAQRKEAAVRKTEWPFGWGRVDYSWEERKRWMVLPFPLSEYRERTDKIRSFMLEQGLDGLVLHGNKGDRAAIRYLSNFEDFYGGDTLVVVPKSGEVGITTNAIMHSEPMHSGIQETWIQDARCAPHPRTIVTPTTSIFDHAEDILKERGLERARIGVAGEYAQDVLITLQQRLPHASFQRETKILPRAMTIKSEPEIQVLKHAARGADAALTALLEGVREGVTEFGLTALANEAMFRFGAEDTGFPIAMATGPRGGFKHTPPQARTLKAGDWVYVDLGCRIHGYYSDASRNRVVGTPTKEQRDFSQANLDIVHACIEAIRPGVRVGDIAKIAERIARERRLEQYLYFRGHGIGTTTHTPPSFSPDGPTILEEGMVFVFEPMLVRKEFGTACVEDMYAVRAHGCERLSEARENWWD